MPRLRPSTLFALLLPAAAFAQGRSATLPDTPVGNAFNQFVKALNSGSLKDLQKFHADRGGEPDMAEQDFGFYQQSGGLEITRVVKASDFEIDVEARTLTTKRDVLFHFAVEPAPPYPVSDIGVRPLGSPGPGGSPEGPRPAEEVITASAAIVDEAIAKGFSGVVLIAKDGAPVLERASGFANRAFEIKNRLDTRFNLGSINKTFTKMAIAQLLAARKLNLDDKLGKILPDFPNAEAAAKVTVAHLIEMRSGLADFFGREFDATSKNRIRTLADYVPLFASKPLAFEPGSAEAYSNGGYVALGLMIEKVSGQTYYDYVRDHIFKAAGMADTDSFEVDAIVPNLATGYVSRSDPGVVSNIYALPGRGSSAGGGYSTAPDLLKYATALVANRLVSAPYTEWCLGGPKPEAELREGGASGAKRGGVGIAGGSPGVNAVLEVNVAQGLVIIVLANQDPPAAEELARKIRLGR